MEIMPLCTASISVALEWTILSAATPLVTADLHADDNNVSFPDAFFLTS